MSSEIRSCEQINLEKMDNHLKRACKECDNYQTEECRPSTCLVGFAEKSLQFALKKGIMDIPGAVDHIPSSDFKYYADESIIPALAETCRQCQECRESHSPNCVIALTRTCLENILLESNISPYPGSVFLYLVSLKKQDQNLGEKLAEELSNK